MCRRLVTVALGWLAVAGAAAAAGPQLTLSAGPRTGDVVFTTEAASPLVLCITTPCVTADVLTEEDDARFTLILDVPLSPRWMVEVLLTEQDGDHEFRSEMPGVQETGHYDWMTGQVGVLRQWREDRWRPFAAGGVGITRFESSVPAYDLPLQPGAFPSPVDEEVLSASLAGGVKVGLGRHFDLRLEGRAWWHDFPSRLGGSLWQGEATVGLTYLW